MLNICTLASLTSYERFVERLTTQWPMCWGLIAQADDKMRAEGLERLRRRILTSEALGRQIPINWDPARPWTAVFDMAIQDTEYWAENVHHPAAAWLASGSRGRPVVASEVALHAHMLGGTDLLAETTGDEGKKRLQANRDKRSARKRKLMEDREELKRLRGGHASGGGNETKVHQGGKGQAKGKSKDQSGKPLCFSWSAGNGTCGHLSPGAECLGSVKRVHKCRICLSPSHQEAKCTSKRWKLSQKMEEVSSLKAGWLKNEEKRLREKQESMGTRRLGHVDEVFTIAKEHTAIAGVDPEKESGPSSSTGATKKQKREAENEFCVGGMRNPLSAVRRLWKVKDTGKKLRKAWEEFVMERPRALLLGDRYGSREAQFDETIAMEWQLKISAVLGVTVRDGLTLRDKLMFKSSLNVDLWRAWFKETGDPDYHIAEWAESGVPLGMNMPIPMSNGVFPATGDVTPEFMEEGPEIEMQSHVTNYRSFLDAPEDAEIEVQRYVEKGFAILMDWEEVQAYFDKGTVSRLALVLKTKPDGSIKRRVVVDLLRPGGNSRTTTPERIVLPRIVDVTRMARELAEKNAEDNGGRMAEFVLYDLQDAFCHFPVCREELANCLAPGNEENQAILFRALLFGFKSAPLLMGRLSAAVGRLWQSMMSPMEGHMQIYVDDVLTLVNGTEDEKANLISMGLYTMKAFGVQIALGKGERGQQAQWIGVRMLLQWPNNPTEGSITYAAPKKMVEEILETLKAWLHKGMISHRELRSTTGRLSWVAGILPRLRWAVSVLFAVLKDAGDDERSGAEEERAQRRQDQRPKFGLVAVKRFGATLRWLVAILSKTDRFVLRREELLEKPVTMGILSDASPLGLGAVLVSVDQPGRAIFIVEAFEAKFTRAEAELLGLEHGESSSQGVLEALAILRAIKLWRTRLQGCAVFVRSDSVVALAMTRRLSSSTPALNHLGGELAIALEQYNVARLVPQHVPGVMNFEPDWLSRPHDRAEAVPANLKKVKIKQLAPVTAEDFNLPPPGAKQHPWEGLPPHNVSVFQNL